MVDVPPLEMVDDILTVQKCRTTSSALNAEVNAFIEQKKLTLGLKNAPKFILDQSVMSAANYLFMKKRWLNHMKLNTLGT